jgi:hypothetical protein
VSTAYFGERCRRGRSHKSLILNDFFLFAFVYSFSHNSLINRAKEEIL